MINPISISRVLESDINPHENYNGRPICEGRRNLFDAWLAMHRRCYSLDLRWNFNSSCLYCASRINNRRKRSRNMLYCTFIVWFLLFVFFLLCFLSFSNQALRNTHWTHLTYTNNFEMTLASYLSLEIFFIV